MLKSAVVLLCLVCLPALAYDISGAWEFNVQTDAGSGTPSFVFQQSGEKLTGTYSGLLGKAELTGSVKGDRIEFSFSFSADGQNGKATYIGVIQSATKMKGEAEYSGLGKATWTASKK